MFNLNNQIQVGPKNFLKHHFVKMLLIFRINVNDDSFEHVKVFDIGKYFIDPMIEEIYSKGGIINTTNYLMVSLEITFIL